MYFKTYQSKKVKAHIIISYYLFRYDDTIPIISYNIRILLELLFKPISNKQTKVSVCHFYKIIMKVIITEYNTKSYIIFIH